MILRPPMRRPHLLLAFAVLALAGCGGPCEDLGERLCGCAGGGATKDACVQGVKDELDRLNPGGDVDAFCEARLDTCGVPAGAPSGTEFCEWVETACGEASCGLSAEPIEQACGTDAP